MTEQTPIRRRLSAILAADIAGYSRLMCQDEAATVRDLKGHQAVVLPLVDQHGGRIIDTAGDGILAEFPSVTDAVACALEIQAVMAERNRPVPEERRMRFRMGINLGDVIFDTDRIYGDGINVAARLEGLAEPEGVLVSHGVYETVRDRLDVAFDDLGEKELKNISRPVRVYRVQAASVGRSAKAKDQSATASNSGADSNSALLSASAKAVFLSYASQDADTARKIAQCLRSVGIEVWFDQAELKGGDAWDRKIRQQIQSCALFVPIISAHTESRPEGYFRLEWWLAEQRSYRMARGMPFLVPVAVGVPANARTKVPDSFTDVQWTRLDGELIPPDFAARVQALLGEEVLRPESASAPVAWQPQPGLVADDKSIAVLAFVNLSSDKENEYFSDGIAEELLNLLAKITQLRVIARTSSFSFKGKDVPIADIARRLNVAHVLEGSVRKAGNRVRVTAQLIRTTDSTHLWSETYDRSLDDIFAVQDDIAAEVVEQLKIRLLGAAPKVVETNSEAYALYLQARQLVRQHTAVGYTQALALLDRVLEIDSAYAPAWTMKSAIYGDQGANGLISEQIGLRLAREAANRALVLDPTNSNAYRRLGWSAIADARDLAAAARYFAQAWALSPTDLGAISSASWLFRCLGRFQPAHALDQHVVSRDPENAGSHMNLGLSCYLMGHFERALGSYRTALGLNPGRFGVRFRIARTLLRLGRPEDALASAQEETGELWRLCAMTMVMHALGRGSESDAAITQLIANFPDGWYQIAFLRAYRGEVDLAFEALEKAVKNRDAGLGLIGYEPLFASLHDDPRWLPFLQEIGMSPEQLDAIPFEVKLPT